MTIITGKFKGNHEDLKMFAWCGVKYISTKFIGINTLIVKWICEEENYTKALEECMECVNMKQLERWNIDLHYFG